MSILWLTLAGMSATIIICFFIIGLARLIRVFTARDSLLQDDEDKDAPPLAAITAAVLAAMDNRVPSGVRVYASDSAWAVKVREDSAGFEGGIQ